MRVSGVLAVTIMLAVTGGCSSTREGRLVPAPQSSRSAGSSGSDEATPAGGPGRYSAFTRGGTLINVDVPARLNDPRVAELEQLRREYDAPPITYLVADVDNRAGRGYAVTEYVVVITEDGQAIEVPYVAGPADAVLEDEVFPSDERVVEFSNSLLNEQRVRPGELQEGLIYATFEEISSVDQVLAPFEELGREVAFEKVPDGVNSDGD